VIIDAKVYDLSRFASMHPGGSSVLFADSIGAWAVHSPGRQADLVFLFQPERMPLKHFLVCTSTKFSCALSTSAYKSGLSLAKWKRSRPPCLVS
jgi:hypothetical protein